MNGKAVQRRNRVDVLHEDEMEEEPPVLVKLFFGLLVAVVAFAAELDPLAWIKKAIVSRIPKPRRIPQLSGSNPNSDPE